MITQELVAENLLWPLWLSVDDDYKSRYAKEIWEHFENAIRSAAYTGSLRVYLSNFQQRIPSRLKAKHLSLVNTIIQSGEDALVLDWLRDETTYLVMLVHIKNQEKKELWKESQND